MISKWETMSRNTAKELAEEWSGRPSEGFNQLVLAWDNREVDTCPISYLPLRQKLVEAYESVRAEAESGNSSGSTRVSQVVYRFALHVYRILNEEGMTVRTASDDGVWRFLSMAVCPDIIYDRWKDKSKPRLINADRFYLATRRIWLKILWWYVYLCWQGSEEKTAELISTNNANEISQLVERAGTGGYRVDLFREIIQYYDTTITQAKRIEEKNLLSRVLQLNIARSQIIEPDLVPGGVAEYVKQLFSYFGY